MSIAAAPVRPLTIQEWYELYHDYEGGRCELVRGRAIMTPTEAMRNANAAKRLERLLDDALAPTWNTVRDVGVVVRSGPLATMREPDLTLVHGDVDDRECFVNASAVALVAEVVSPSSVETDWVTKRAEYAAAGIPNYLVVDVRFNEGPRLWLFDRIVPVDEDETGGRTTYARYKDPTGDGLSVNVRIPGFDPITITAAGLV